MDVINEQTLAETHVIHHTRADFSKRMPQDVVHLVQYDNSLPVLKVDLYLNGSSYTLPSTATVYIRWGKKDHTFVYKEVLGKSQDGKSVFVEVDDQMTYYFGNPAPILELKLGANSAGSSALNITIDRNPIQNGDIESHSDYPDLEEAVRRAEQASSDAQEAAEKAEEAAAQIQTLEDQVDANTAAISAIKDGTSIDSFSDVELALAGKQATIDALHMLSADLVDDDDTVHKFVTAEEKEQITTNANDITAIKDGQSIDSFGDVESALSGKQDKLTDSSSIDLTNNVVSVKDSYVESFFATSEEIDTMLEEVFGNAR